MSKRLIAIAIAVVLAVAAGALLLAERGDRSSIARASVDPDTMRLVADTVRIRLELLNATGERGLARRAMLYFRDRGFDVVSVGNASERLDSTLVLDRSEHAGWAELAARAAGGAQIEARPDASRYLDLTVLLGRSFRPPSQILYP